MTPNATNNWFLTSAGQLNGSFDSITIEKANINVGRFVQSASQPSPPQALPATMTLTQGLHWFCPQAPAATRWRMPAFVTLGHSRSLRNRAGVVEFVTTVNGLEHVETYDGPLAVSNFNASPANTPRSPPAPPTPTPTPTPPTSPTPTPTPPTSPSPTPAAPAARTVALTVDSLPTAIPAGQSIGFSFVGGNLGCSVAANASNNHLATLTVGTSAGTVTVEAADNSGVNRARVGVTIT